MAASNNPFYVAPPDVMQSLMAFDQSYNAARKDADQEQIKAARIQAGQAIQSGADPKMVLGTLMKYDPATASAYGALLHQQAMEKLGQTAQVETGRHNLASEAQSAASLAQTGKHQTEELGLKRDIFDTGKTQVIPDAFGGFRVVRTGPKGYEELPVTGGTSAPPAPAMTSGTPAPPNQNITSGTVTGVDYGPVQTAGGPVSPVRLTPPTQTPAPAQSSNADALMQKYGGKPGDGKDWAYLASLPEKAQENVVRLANHDLSPSTFPARTMQGQGESARSAYSTAAAKFDETYNQQDYPLIQQNRQKFDTGDLGNTVRSLGVAVEHAATLKELGLAMKTGNNQLINSILQRWSEKTGNPMPGNVKLAAQVVGTELVKALGVANAGTGEERGKLSQAVSPSSSPQQIVSVVDDVVRPLLGGQLRGLRRQFTESTKRSADEFNRKLPPEAIDFLDKKSGGGVSAEGGRKAPPPGFIEN